MKKFLFGLVLAVASVMFSSCYFFEMVSADVKVVNKSSRDIYCMADYNQSLSTSAKAKLVASGKTVSFSCEGLYTQATMGDYEYFTFHYMDGDSWTALKTGKSYQTEWFLMTSENTNHITVKQKGQSYTVYIEDDEGSSSNWKVTVKY